MTCGWFVAIVLVIAPAALCFLMWMCVAFLRWLASDGVSGHWGRCEMCAGGCRYRLASEGRK